MIAKIEEGVDKGQGLEATLKDIENIRKYLIVVFIIVVMIDADQALGLTVEGTDQGAEILEEEMTVSLEIWKKVDASNAAKEATLREIALSWEEAAVEEVDHPLIEKVIEMEGEEREEAIATHQDQDQEAEEVEADQEVAAEEVLVGEVSALDITLSEVRNSVTL